MAISFVSQQQRRLISIYSPRAVNPNLWPAPGKGWTFSISLSCRTTVFCPENTKASEIQGQKDPVGGGGADGLGLRLCDPKRDVFTRSSLSKPQHLYFFLSTVNRGLCGSALSPPPPPPFPFFPSLPQLLKPHREKKNLPRAALQNELTQISVGSSGGAVVQSESLL